MGDWTVNGRDGTKVADARQMMGMFLGKVFEKAKQLQEARYVERNAYGAKLCQRPEQWLYGSLYHWTKRTTAGKTRLSSWPIRRRSDWAEHVAMDFSLTERQQLDWSARRGVPFGDETWVELVARKFDLESTMRPRGRPRKSQPAELIP